MTAKKILTEAIKAYNLDTFDEEQKHLHVSIRKFLIRGEATHSPEFNRISLVIPNYPNITTYYNEKDEEKCYQDLLMSFINHSLNYIQK